MLAKPPVRKLARDLGVDLTTVPATGPGGIVTREDVEHAASTASTSVAPASTASTSVAPASTASTSVAPASTASTSVAPASGVQPGEVRARRQRETRIPIRGVRKLTAEAMVASAFTAPHVTEWLSVDVTRTMRLVDRLRADREFAAVKVSPLLLVAKALLIAVRRHPEINATGTTPPGRS